MTSNALWDNKYYIQSVSGVVVFFFIVAIVVYSMQKRNPKWIGIWAAIKSWVITAPFIFVFFALPSPWPLIFVVMISISGAKAFFRMTGMYHRSWYVWCTYLFIFMQGYLIYKNYERIFHIMPMILLGTIGLIPLFRDSANRMIQYMALTLLNFIFMGWGFLHLGRILSWEGGALIALYLVIIAELSESAHYLVSSQFGKHRPLQNITTRFTWEGFIASIIFALMIAWGLRHMLPIRTEPYWVAAALGISIFSRMGSLIMSVIRRDLGVKESGIFIIGRDDILARIDSLMFSVPIVYFLYRILDGLIEL
jgi:phosphatidate cytidylyltransferase